MLDLLLQFAENIGLAVLLTFGLSAVSDRLAPHWPKLVEPVGGLLCGLLAMVFMSLSFEVVPGVIYDLRNLVIFLAGPFGGPVAAAVAGVVAGAYRIYLGGAGAFAGTAAIASAAALGSFVAWKYTRLTTWKSAALWGAALFCVTVPWVLTIGNLTLGWALLEQVAVPSAIFYVGGSVLLSTLFMAGLRRRQTEKLLAENETRFRDIAEMASDWFWEMDENLQIVYVSHRLREITGFGSDYFKGKRRRDLVAKVSKAELEAHEELLRQHKPFRNFRYALRTADGNPRDVITSGKPIFDDSGRFRGYRGSGRDVSAEVRFRQEMEAARLNAELANKAKSDFLASMSHELRTPLNAIIGFSEIMKKEMFGKHSVPSYQGYSADIHSSAEYLLSLVNDILDVARLESGQVDLNRASCDLAQIISSALRMLEERAEKHGLQLTKDIQPHMPIAWLDERAIKQVIVNVVTNAVKFTEPGGSVAVQARFMGEEGYEITVTDSGVGIATDDLEAVMKPFQQSASGKNMTREGTGLGLPLSKALIEAHDGHLELESELGSGTTVRIHLPQNAARLPARPDHTPTTTFVR